MNTMELVELVFQDIIFERNGPSKRLQLFLLLLNLFKIKRRRLKHNRVRMYEDVVNCYLPDDFRSHFRMSRSSMEAFIKLCGSYKPNEATGRPQLSIALQCLICIWVLANQESYRSIADRFDVAKSTVWQSLIRICKILNRRGSKFISWPKGQKALEIIEGFRKIRGFPGVIGTIDGCHINISPPHISSAAYINRKGQASMILQGVCDHKYIFTDCFIGFPGSVHDAGVFQRSKVFGMCNNNFFPYSSHMLGDSAYPLNDYLMTPIRDNGHLTCKQLNFNKSHAATRCTIERAFGILKARWRRLHYLELHNSSQLAHVIMAACILHNFCIMNHDDLQETIETSSEDGHPEDETSNSCSQTDSKSAHLKRNNIVNYF